MSSLLTRNSVLSSGHMRMPVVGLGTWQATEQVIGDALSAALDAGYRHIDTAYMYENEKFIGKCLQKHLTEGKIKREDIFVVTKLPLFANRAEHVEMYLKKSLEALQLDYIDLYLIHHPVGFKHHGPDALFPKDESGNLDLDYETDHVSLWKAMEAQVDAGRAKAIGVSNFNKSQLTRIIENCRIPIANNQIELNVYLQQPELVSFCKENNITVCAYAPLGSPGYIKGLESISDSTEGANTIVPLEDPVVLEIAKHYNKLPGQVLLRYLLECGVAVIPKSGNPERIKQNIDVFDFELSKEDFEKLKRLNRGENARIFTAAGVFAELKKHPEYPHPN